MKNELDIFWNTIYTSAYINNRLSFKQLNYFFLSRKDVMILEEEERVFELSDEVIEECLILL